MLNKVLLIGNLTSDPRELRTTQGGAVVGEFRIAVNDPVRRDAEPLFIDVTVWNKTAENCHQYLAKGRPVLVEGRLEEDSWTDKETGQPRSKMRVVANQVTFMPDRKDDGGGEQRSARQTTRREPQHSGSGGGPLRDYGLDG